MPAPVLLLDVLDTLVVDPTLEVVGQCFSCTLEELRTRKSQAAWESFERGEIDREEFGRTYFRDGEPLDIARLESELSARFRFVEGIEDLLRDLRAQGTAMHAPSNYPVWSELIEAKLSLSDYVPWTFVSWKTGLRKPDPLAYRYAARFLDVPPSELIFVDDRKRNCDAARECGLTALLFRDAKTLRDELTQLGVLQVTAR